MMGTVETTMAPVNNLVDMVLKLPEIQRNYVWNRPQVRDLLDSLYRGYPVGTVLIWQTEEAPISRELESGAVGGNGRMLDGGRFLLDGQQRLTSLTKAIQTNEVDIRFNLETEEFQVANATVKRDPRFVPVAEVFQKGAITAAVERELIKRTDAQEVLNRLNRLEAIGKYQVPVHVLKGFNYEEVTDIFLRVNSKGTRLREAELAIARLAFRLPGMVTDDLGKFEDDLERINYDIELRFLVRCMTAVATGQSRFPPLATVSEDRIREAWAKTRRGVNYFVNLLRQNLGIESTDWLPSINAFVVPVTYLSRISDARQADRKGLLRWFVTASMWQRYAGSAETTMDQDLRVLSEPEPLGLLIDDIRQSIGRLEVAATDLDDAGVNSPFFLPMYLACRHVDAMDWWTNVRLSSTNLGTEHALELHHIFPKARVKDNHPRRDVNELANMAFLSKRANLEISANEPATYLPGVDSDRLSRQFVPLDASLWTLERFQDFLAARRSLLASGINAFLKTLE